MNTPKFRLLLWPRANAKDLFPIKCCIAFAGKRRYYSTGLLCQKNEWECSTGRIKPKNRAKDNGILTALESRADKILRDWQKDNITFSFSEFESEMFSNTGAREIPTITRLMRDAAQRCEKNNQVSSAAIRLVVSNIIASELPEETPASVRADQVKKVIGKMAAAGMRQNTINTYMAVLRAECKPFFKKGLMKIEALESMSAPRERAEKHAIPRETMRLFEQYDNPLSGRERFYLDLFIMSFYLRGMNLADISRLKPENIQGEILTYERKKTGARLRIKILPPALSIIEKYRSDQPYIFQIIKPQQTEKQKKQVIDDLTLTINKTLRRIAAALGLPERTRQISFYTARHTYATTLKRQGVDIGLISELIGHSDVATTQIYLDSFEDSALDSADALLMK